jgi:phosphatidylglycerol:prolipoprotein diacylglycerol transferase
MIPYFRLTTVELGPFHIQVWGAFVAAGILLAAWVGAREAARRGLDREKFLDLASWAVIAALVGARLGHVLFYEPAAYAADPLAVLRVWEGGMSMVGGLLGGALGAAWFARRARLNFFNYADAAAFALPLGYGCGRLGCFLIHDHPGTLSDSFLAVRFPTGARLDHGLLLSLFGFALAAAFFLVRRVRPQATGYLPVFMVCYGAARFLFDFYRAVDLPGSDIRMAGLTPAQYAGAALLLGGVVIWHSRKKLYALPHA